MSIYVPGCGNSNARIMIVGEAPGKEEEAQKLPFIGPAGQLLNEVLRYANIERPECYVTNVVKVRPPQNNLKKLGMIGHTIEEFIPQLLEEIQVINPNVIFGLGNLPLETLTGMKGIMNYR